LTYPNTLIFIDLPSDDPARTAEFYAEVFGWENDPRPYGSYHRMVPGSNFRNKDGSDSTIGNLHIGIYNVANSRPHPEPDGVAPRILAPVGRQPRIWILISDDDTPERLLDAAQQRGAEILWRNHYWSEFNGFNHAFRDPWGNEIILWGKAGATPVIPPGTTQE